MAYHISIILHLNKLQGAHDSARASESAFASNFNNSGLPKLVQLLGPDN